MSASLTESGELAVVVGASGTREATDALSARVTLSCRSERWLGSAEVAGGSEGDGGVGGLSGAGGSGRGFESWNGSRYGFLVRSGRTSRSMPLGSVRNGLDIDFSGIKNPPNPLFSRGAADSVFREGAGGEMNLPNVPGNGGLFLGGLSGS
jgi:hypothetical protein